MSSVPPNQTVYVANLNESVKKEELRRCLYSLFGQYGRIMDIVALKTKKMRGQAFVVFSDIPSATAAMRSLNGFKFFGRPIRVGYAKTKSHAVQKEEGTFGRPDKKRKMTAPAAHAAIKNGAPGTTEGAPGEADADTQPPNKILFLSNLPEEGDGKTREAMIQMLFHELEGFKEVRLVEGRPDIAFVEYENEDNAAAAKYTLQGFKITPTNTLGISFAKK
eukprot:m.336677 g.336677  ORF g.336677 m.336677 type:complete len:220 (-) comp17924_c0_seq1:85-744(-)